MNVSHEKLGLLFILVGPTGAGKNTIMNGVLQRLPAIEQLPTATTRAIRPNEREGREHHFVTIETFEQMIAAGDLLEWQRVHGRYYGVPRRTVEHLIANRLDRIADVDILGALEVRAQYPDNTVLVFIQPGASDDVEKTVTGRLEKRGETPQEIQRRLKRVTMEMALAPRCDYLVINENINSAIEQMIGIVQAERSRRDLDNLRVRQGLPRHRMVHSAVALALQDNRLLCQYAMLPRTQVHRSERPQDALFRLLSPFRRSEIIIDDEVLAVTAQQRDYYDELVFWFRVHVESISDELAADWSWQDHVTTTIPPQVLSTFQPIS